MRHATCAVALILAAAGNPLSASAQQTPLPGGRPYSDNAYIAVPPPDPQTLSFMQVMTTDGRTLEGSIVGGSLTVQTALGTRDVAAARIKVLTAQLLALDDGFTHSGSLTILDGSVKIQTKEGIQTVPAMQVYAIRGTHTYGALPATAPAVGTSSEETGEEPHELLLGKWSDSQSGTWEFFKDGKVLLRQQLEGRYALVDAHHLRIDLWMFGMQMGQVYDIVDMSHDQITMRQQGAQITLRRSR